MTSDTIVIDKLAFVQNLESRGFSRNQAEGLAQAVNDIALAQLVTKTDLYQSIGQLKIDLYKFLASVLIAHGLGTAALTVALIELLK